MKLRQIAAALCLCSVLALVAGCGDDTSAENELAYRKIGINCMESGDYEGALEAFQSALDESDGKISAEEIDICYYKAAAQYALGDAAGAEETYTSLIKYDDENADAYYLRGTVYLESGDSENAIKDYEASLEAEDGDYERYLEISNALKDADMEDVGATYLEQALELKAKDGDDYMQQGRIYMLLEDYENAQTSLETAIDEGTEEAELYLAQCYEAQGDTDKAQSLYESYVESHADDSETLNTLGCMAMEKEDYESALKYFQMGLAVENPTNEQELLKNEIAVYEYSGDFDSAKETMESYLEAYPDDEEAVRENTFLQTR